MNLYQILNFVGILTLASAKKLHYIHWNKNNPMFRLDNTDHIVEVNGGNLPWEYDQVNIICPTSKPGTRYPERHVIYSVSREEFDSCRITNPKPKIVAICNKPHSLMYFTITFRSFTPTPGGLEFHPGQDYYFISTSSRDDLHRRVGGGCATHNMKMIFKVADIPDIIDGEEQFDIFQDQEDNAIEDILEGTFDKTMAAQSPKPRQRVFHTSAPGMRGVYYYHPKDLMDLERQQEEDQDIFSNELPYGQVWRQKKALRLTSASSVPSAGLWQVTLAIAMAKFALINWNFNSFTTIITFIQKSAKKFSQKSSVQKFHIYFITFFKVIFLFLDTVHFNYSFKTHPPVITIVLRFQIAWKWIH